MQSAREPVDRRTGTAFMLGGGSVLVGLTLLFPVQAGAEGLFLLPAALFLLGAAAIVLGLLGLRHRLVAATPTLVRTGAAAILGLTGLTLVALLVIGGLTLLDAGLGLNVPEAPEFGLATPPLFGAIVVGKLLFGVASLRAGVPSRALGGLLIAVAVLWVAGFSVGLRGQEFDLWDFLAMATPALGTVLVGAILQTTAGTETVNPGK